MKQEKRFNAFQNLEIRDGTNGSRKVAGYPIVFNSRSSDLGGFVEIIDPHALDDLDLSDLMLVYGHEINEILARGKAGNLTTNIDDKGLYFEATLPNTTLANDVLENIRVGNIGGMSFSFSADDSVWSNDNGQDVRTLKHIDFLPEITITPFPAYPDTSVATSQRDKFHASLETNELNSKRQAQLDLVRARQKG